MIAIYEHGGQFLSLSFPAWSPIYALFTARKSANCEFKNHFSLKPYKWQYTEKNNVDCVALGATFRGLKSFEFRNAVHMRKAVCEENLSK
jgi:hypothetical protein